MIQINYTEEFEDETCVPSYDEVTLKYKEEDALTPEFKEKWVKALRSGKYSQGESYLMSPIVDGDDLYCCLGVACDIQGIELGCNEQYPADDYDVPNMLKAKSDVAEFLADKNDNAWNFNHIADWIEEYL